MALIEADNRGRRLFQTLLLEIVLSNSFTIIIKHGRVLKKCRPSMMFKNINLTPTSFNTRVPIIRREGKGSRQLFEGGD